MPLVKTRGVASAQGFGEFAQATVANYIEEMFSTYLYTGNGSTQTITNGIDLSTYGGLVWLKNRTADGSYTAANYVVDSARSSFRSYLITNATNTADAETVGKGVTSVSTTGFVLGTSNISTNTPAVDYVSWTFRKQPKFFDVVTYTGTGSNATIAHSLGSVPGCIIVKRTDTTADWAVYHRSLANTQYLVLNTTAAAATGATWWNSTTPTSAVFSVGTDASVNASGGTYVAYLFAHDAGGFGLTGTDNVISCGYAAGGTTVNLGYEPQWVLTKNPNIAGNWFLFDSMRGMPADGSGAAAKSLLANAVNVEQDASGYINPTSTGFYNGVDAIYIAIRRGPMKVPTLGTTVFTAETYSGNNTLNREFSVAPVQYSDLSWFISRNYPTAPVGISFVDRLRGILPKLWTGGTNSETTSQASVSFGNKMEAIVIATTGNLSGLNESGTSFVMYNLKRAPRFFDEVCYTGTASNPGVLNHNLSVVPELMIVKCRSNVNYWAVYTAFTGNTKSMLLPDSGAAAVRTTWSNTSPTDTTFTVENDSRVFSSGLTYVAYLFASTAGVSKVGNYTGNGTTQTIDCGFTGGVRFVLIKRTDSTGDWYVYDTARGMTVLTDPYLLINSTAAETATLGSVTTVSTGFALNSAILADINISAGTYIFLAIA